MIERTFVDGVSAWAQEGHDLLVQVEVYRPDGEMLRVEFSVDSKQGRFAAKQMAYAIAVAQAVERR